MQQSIWSPAERQAWAPREKTLPSQWAERHAVIPDNGINPEPGPVSLDRTPYLRGPLDAAVDPEIEELVFLKCTQVGFSTLLRLLICFWIDQDPGPLLVTLPDELSAKEWLDEDVVPTLEQTARLKPYLLPRKKDNKTTAIRLTSMWIFAAWAGSAQRLARRPIRYLFGDEIDKYPAFSGRESDPISLGLKRLSNWGKRAKAIFGSTPTTRAGNVWRRWEACADQRKYHVPCPHCGQFQELTWPQVKGWKEAKAQGGDKKDLANRIRIDALAYYECIGCKGKIEDRHKYQMLVRGDWVSQGQQILPSGEIVGDRPRSKRVGFHLSSLYSPWVSFATLAAEWVLAEGDIGLTMDFRNSRLGLPFEQLTQKTRASTIRAKVQDELGNPLPTAPKPFIVPKWGKVLIATADTQGADASTGWFPFVVRTWSYGFRSQLVHYGIVSTFEELHHECLDRFYDIEGGGKCQGQILLIDSGGPRWSEVYQFAQADPARIHATKGMSRPLPVPVQKSHLKTQGIILWKIDTSKSKDLLNRLIHDPDPGKWMPHAGIDEAYCQQIAAEHKVIDPKTKIETWEKVSSGAANHFLDCEAEQCAAAWDLGAGQADTKPAEPTAPETTESYNPLNSYKGRY